MDVSSFRRFGVLRLSFVLVLATALSTEAQPTSNYSFSVAEAKSRGTFVIEIEMVPGILKWKGHTITIKDAWIEKCKSGGCYLCFQLKEGKDAFRGPGSAMFVLEDDGASAAMLYARDWTQVTQYLESWDFAKARFSLVGGFKEERPKNIKFTWKKQL